MQRMKFIALVTALLALLGGCGGDKATLVLVTVSARPGVSAPTTLLVTFTHSGLPQTKSLGGPGASISLPATFVLRADGYGGAAKVAVKALDGQNQVLGEAEKDLTLSVEGNVALGLELLPSDFLVNNRTQYSQIFSVAESGRQLASDSQGNFVVLWEDTGSGLSNFDIWYRLFDAKGAPRANGASGKTEQFAANAGTAYYDHPAVAAVRGGPSDGNFVVAFLRSADGGKTTDIYVRSFLSNGKPNSAAGGGKEVALTGSGKASRPALATTADGTFMVVWEESSSSGGPTVMGRLLDIKGQPTAGPGGSSGSFVVGTTASSSAPAAAAVTGGRNGGFMVVYNDAGTVRATAYGAKKDQFALLARGVAAAKTSTGVARNPAVGPLLYGYAVAWTDRVSFPPDTDGTCIRLRRFDFAGSALEKSDYTVNTTTKGNQQQPVLAMANDGKVLVAWSAETNLQSDPLGGVRGRLLLADGMPVGDDRGLNSTTTAQQSLPALAPHGQSSFIVAFVDKSGAKPDTDGSAIRARLLYPDYAPKDGKVGAVCDETNRCGGGLICVSGTKSGTRCLATCKGGSEAACLHGGVCTKDDKLGTSYCTY